MSRYLESRDARLVGGRLDVDRELAEQLHEFVGSGWKSSGAPVSSSSFAAFEITTAASSMRFSSSSTTRARDAAEHEVDAVAVQHDRLAELLGRGLAAAAAPGDREAERQQQHEESPRRRHVVELAGSDHGAARRKRPAGPDDAENRLLLLENARAEDSDRAVPRSERDPLWDSADTAS